MLWTLRGALPMDSFWRTWRREIIRGTIAAGIEQGQLRAALDVERAIDMLMGALFAAAMAAGRPGPDWPRQVVDTLWPALAADGPTG